MLLLSVFLNLLLKFYKLRHGFIIFAEFRWFLTHVTHCRTYPVFIVSNEEISFSLTKSSYKSIVAFLASIMKSSLAKIISKVNEIVKTAFVVRGSLQNDFEIAWSGHGLMYYLLTQDRAFVRSCRHLSW